MASFLFLTLDSPKVGFVLFYLLAAGIESEMGTSDDSGISFSLNVGSGT